MSELLLSINSCGAQASLLLSIWNLPRPRIKPMSPVLAGESTDWWILNPWTTREFLQKYF